MVPTGVLPPVVFPRAECETCEHGTRSLRPVEKAVRLHDGRIQNVRHYECVIECQHECEHAAEL
jgi:hypothetical protein